VLGALLCQNQCGTLAPHTQPCLQMTGRLPASRALTPFNPLLLSLQTSSPTPLSPSASTVPTTTGTLSGTCPILQVSRPGAAQTHSPACSCGKAVVHGLPCLTN
jgi:hypothetical protein